MVDSCSFADDYSGLRVGTLLLASGVGMLAWYGFYALMAALTGFSI